MTKNILLTASALTVLAFAGAAQAQTVTGALVSGQTAKTGVTNTPLAVATESVAAPANRRSTTVAGDNAVTFTTSGATPLVLERGTTYRVTYALTGTATPTFLAQVTASAFTTTNPANVSCIGTPAVVSGTGAGGSSSVSFTFTVPASNATCTDLLLGATTSFTTDIPFGVAALGTVSATVSGALDPSNTNPAATANRFTAAGSTVQLAQTSAGYRIFVDGNVDSVTGDGIDNADFPTNLSLGSSGAPFRTFTSADNIIGAAGLVAAPAPTGSAGGVVFANYAAGGLVAPTYTLAVQGDFTTLKPQIDTDDTAGGEVDITPAANNLSATTGTLAGGGRNVKLRIEGTPTASIATVPQGFAATVTAVAPAANDTLVTLPVRALTAQPLETVGLQGTTFVAPWVQSTNANYTSVLRISNAASTATGSVMLTISSPIATVTRITCDSAVLPKLASVPAFGELAISSADLTTCFGNFTRADVSATILSLSNNLTAKLRIVSPGNVVTEQSLGRFGAPVSY